MLEKRNVVIGAEGFEALLNTFDDIIVPRPQLSKVTFDFLQMPTRQVETVERKVAETSVGNPSRHMQLRVYPLG